MSSRLEPLAAAEIYAELTVDQPDSRGLDENFLLIFFFLSRYLHRGHTRGSDRAMAEETATEFDGRQTECIDDSMPHDRCAELS